MPQAKEVVVGSAELPVKLSELKEFTQELSKQYGITFDFSAFETFSDKENWMLELLTNEKTRTLLSDLVVSHQNNGEEKPFLEAVVECARIQGVIEPDKDLYARSQIFGTIIHDYVHAPDGQDSKVKDDEKLLVISHGRIMRAMLSSGVVEGKKPGAGFKDTMYFDNAQLVPMYFKEGKATHVKQS